TTGVKLLITSRMGVETMGLPDAMYSSVLVGLMNSVALFSANGMRQTSNALRYRGRSAYDRWPSHTMFGAWGRSSTATLTTGPIMRMVESGRAAASDARRS